MDFVQAIDCDTIVHATVEATAIVLGRVMIFVLAAVGI